MIAIIDYGAGNLFSVQNALSYLDILHQVTDDPQVIERANGIILPGVGAFPDAMNKLGDRRLIPVLRKEAQKKPFLGICLGMQVLFSMGYEFQEMKGLGILPGTVERIQGCGLKIPHMGWNSLHIRSSCPLLADVSEGEYVYFVHSFQAFPQKEHLAAWVDYGVEIPALVWKGQVFGCQFHPEKSADTGLRILKSFGGLCR